MAETTSGPRKGKGLPKRKLAALRKLLEAEREQLAAQISKLDAEFLDESWKEPRSDDDAESGTATFERERMMSLSRNARVLLEGVERALARMDADVYGRCVSCGEMIHIDRLEALPQAADCVECRRKAERSSR
jgi:DnaK suppressor protein